MVQGARLVVAARLSPTDRLFLGFLGLNSAWLLWHAGVVNAWPLLLVANALSLFLVWLLRRGPDTALVRFLRGGYPLVLTAAYYPQIGIINTGIAQVHDQLVQHWEAALFGSQISVTWHQAQPDVLLSMVLHICYGSFYWVVLLAPVFLFLRRDQERYTRAAFVMTLVLYACYVGFLLFPVAGPRYFFGVATGPAADVPVAQLVHRVLEGGSAWGTAFPSSHVAAALAAVYVLWRDARWLAVVLAPIAIGVPFGTVYGQFHYGVDALAGAAVGVVLCAAADPLRSALRSGTPPSPP